MKPSTHYTAAENGFAISGSNEIFNRTLYGSHKNDHRPERFFTFAGDAPQFMGAISDWTKGTVTLYEKCGVLRSGLAITPGQRSRFYYTEDIDQTSKWFHDSEDISAEFKNGWMEYELSQISAWFPDVYVQMQAYPLLPDDGYLVHYRIKTNQHVYFAAGFGGLTGENCRARYEYKGEPKRHFNATDAQGNVVKIGKNHGCVICADGKTMHVATSFPAEFALGSAAAMAESYPSTFLGSVPENDDDCVVKISAPIAPGQVLDGYVIALYNSDEKTLDKWLSMEKPVEYIKQQIYAKFACINVATPQKTLDLTVAPTVIALDSSWHKDSFHHGAFAYHAPFLGWRNWYAPTALGWRERVEKTMEMWLSHITRGDISMERVWYDDTVVPDGENKFVKKNHNIENPVGRLPASFVSKGELKYVPDNMGDDVAKYGPYNMQECALDMMLYYIEWSGNLEIAEKYFDDFCAMVDWETRTFDPDGDGLYQNFLNTWISDGHNYNGAGCAQSTAYNYRANAVLAKIADKIGRDGTLYRERAEKIKKALNEKLWIANEGVIAESLDTVGNCLIHPSVELATVYHVMDSDMIDHFKAYRTLKYTQNHIKNIETIGLGGRLCYSSNWLPRQYSNCGIFPAENAHLALMYFKLGLKEEGKKILDGIVDCYFTGKNPGMAPHVQSPRGTSDLGDLDFSDVSSTYLRLVVEGLFGIRVNHLDGCVYIQPGFPDEWEHASVTLADISLHYIRRGNQEIFDISCDRTEEKQIRIAMRSTDIEAVLLDGVPADYEIVAAPNNSFIVVKTDKVGFFSLRVMHASKPMPTVKHAEKVLADNKLVLEAVNAEIAEVFDVSKTLSDIKIIGNKIYAKAMAVSGDHTLFVRVKTGEYDAWLAADYEIVVEETEKPRLEEKPFEPVDISPLFNCNMTQVHEKAYIYPRPEGYSMGSFQNGRYSHNWNQRGRFVAYVDDASFRNAGGMVYSPSGIPFKTPAENENLACVSIFDTFPTSITFPLSGKGQELAVLFVASTNCMLSYVENARITVHYADGTSTHTKLIYPLNLDDWLTSALTTEAEIFYFSTYNHATVQRIVLDAEKEIESVQIEAVANDVILGVAGISIARSN